MVKFEAKRRRDKNEGRKIVGAINSCKILRFVPKPTNFLLPFASSKSLWKKRKPPPFLSFFALIFFPPPLPSRRKNRGFPSNSADNPRACERAVISKSTAINKRDKSPRSIFHRRAILSSGAARVPCRLASILRSLTLSLPSSILAKSSPRFFRSKPPRDTLNHSPRRNLEFSCEEKKKKKKNNRPFFRIDTNGITDEEDLSNHVSRPTWLYFST